MKITFKLYASLGDYLPRGAQRNTVEVELEEGASLNQLIDRFGVPRTQVHLVLVNGVYQDEAGREQPLLKEGDAVAVWPPVAGG